MHFAADSATASAIKIEGAAMAERREIKTQFTSETGSYIVQQSARAPEREAGYL